MERIFAKACGLWRILTTRASAGARSSVKTGLPSSRAAASFLTAGAPTWARPSREPGAVTIMLIAHASFAASGRAAASRRAAR